MNGISTGEINNPCICHELGFQKCVCVVDFDVFVKPSPGSQGLGEPGAANLGVLLSLPLVPEFHVCLSAPGFFLVLWIQAQVLCLSSKHLLQSQLSSPARFGFWFLVQIDVFLISDCT